MIFPARFSSECFVCEKRIHENDPVTWRDEEVVHERCAEAPLAAEVEKANVCPRCFMVKPVSGECCE